MILPSVPERALSELGRTEGGPETLGLLIRDQHTRRLLLLRAVLDAAEAADAAVCSADVRARLLEDWALLEQADRAASPAPSGASVYAEAGAHASGGGTRATAPAAETGATAFAADAGPIAFLGEPGTTASVAGARAIGSVGEAGATTHLDKAGATSHLDTAGAASHLERAGAASHLDMAGARVSVGKAGAPVSGGRAGATGGLPISPVRALLLHPFVGPWARHCLRGLGGETGPCTEQGAREVSRGLAYFGALAAVAGARAGVSFAVRLTARDGVLTLPSLGTLRTDDPGDTPVDVVHRRHRLTLRQPGGTDIAVHLQSGVGAWSDAAAWTPAHALPGLLPDSAPVPLDDLDPYRTVRGGPRHHALSGPVTLDDAERKRWLHSWSGTASVLGLGGVHRLAEAVALLRCLVPLSAPPGSVPGGRPGGSCSGTRREAFGAVLSSTPPTPTAFAATLVHELQHTKLAALSDMLTLHHADSAARYFAPWRPDPRPYDGLLQGAYSHLALSDFFQRCALGTTQPAHRDAAWAQHARYREQVGAVLPTLVGSGDLTAQGRRFVDQMVAVYERLSEHPAPRGQAARAQAYVRAARALWTQRHMPGE